MSLIIIKVVSLPDLRVTADDGIAALDGAQHEESGYNLEG
jgi:hypothetical protein